MRLTFAYDADDDEDEWILLEPYVRQTPFGEVTVPPGFRTDLASVPRQVWRLYPKFGRWTGAAVVHDYLYRSPGHLGRTRAEADIVFDALLHRDGVRLGDRRIMVAAVREFGGSSWLGD